MKIRGTVLGAADFARYCAGLGNDRLSPRDGKLVPIPRSEMGAGRGGGTVRGRAVPGPPSSIVMSTWTRELCADAAYMKMRLERIAISGIPPSEAAQLKA
jgi:hypothetical protein